MTTPITGNTYPVRKALQALGGYWDQVRKAWMVPDDKAEQARRLVAGAPVPKAKTYSRRRGGTSAYRPQGMGGLCAACGDDCGGGMYSCGYGNTPRGGDQ